MPKIEVIEKQLYDYIGKSYSHDDLEELLTAAKAELDDADPEAGTLKVELNDTNRPDLWSTAGLGRQLKIYEGGKIPSYDFFSTAEKSLDSGKRRVKVDPGLKDIRPYITAFAVTGKVIDEATLLDIIQTQEKLCWNFGRKRKSIAMGVYRSDLIQYPVQYKAVDPEATRFQPLGLEEELSLMLINQHHPKGQEYGHIVADFEKFPFLTDNNGEVLSYPPVINSAKIGAVEVGDENLFVEMTGTDLPSLLLAASIVACDLADSGHTILPVTVEYPYDTPYGREITTPFYFQEPAEAGLGYVNKMLGEELTKEQVVVALGRMGCVAEIKGDAVFLRVPEYRNDFLHAADVGEDVAIGRGLNSFEPLLPRDYTVGRLTEEEVFGRQVRNILVGLGFQEMMYNYLGSAKEYIDKMNLPREGFVQVANPMSENYEFVRASILPELLGSEAVSGNAVYPHNIFEVGKVAFLDDADVTGTATRNYLGFLSADGEAGFNLVNSQVSALMYYLSREYQLKELSDPRFIPGRCARIVVNGREAGVFGEVHPEVLENWGISMPTTMCEVDLDIILNK